MKPNQIVRHDTLPDIPTLAGEDAGHDANYLRLDTDNGPMQDDLDMGFFDIDNPGNMDGSVQDISGLSFDTATLDEYWRFEGNGTSTVGTIAIHAGGSPAFCDRGNTAGWDGTGDVGDFWESATFGPIGSSARTVMAWVKNSSVGSSQYAVSYGDSQYWALGLTSDTPPKMTIDTGAGNHRSNTLAVLSDGNWHHIAVALVGTTMENMIMYLDGIAITSAGNNTTTINTSNETVEIGSRSGGQFKWSDCLDEVAIFSGVVTPDEILDIYNRQAQRIIQGTGIPDARDMYEDIHTRGDGLFGGNIDVAGDGSFENITVEDRVTTDDATVNDELDVNGALFVDGVSRLGDGGTTDYSEFEADGTLEFHGDAIVWNDIQTGFAAARVPQANAPSWDSFVGNLNAYTFGNNDYIEFDPLELLHGYMEGSDFELHMHWVTNGLDGTDRAVRWEIEYTIANMGNPTTTGVGDAFPAPTVVEMEQVIPANTPDRTHMYLDLSDITAGTFEVGALITFRVRRIAAVGDDPSSNPFGLQVGVHYMTDTVGSRTEYTK